MGSLEGSRVFCLVVIGRPVWPKGGECCKIRCQVDRDFYPKSNTAHPHPNPSLGLFASQNMQSFHKPYLFSSSVLEPNLLLQECV